MGVRREEVWYIPGEDGLFKDQEFDKEGNPLEREGYFEFWGIYSTVEFVQSQQGPIPISLTLTVGIIRDKLTGRCCMAKVNQIRFK